MAETMAPSDSSLPVIVETFCIMQKTPSTERAYRCDVTQALQSLGLWEGSSFADLKLLSLPTLHRGLVAFLEAMAKRDHHGHVINGNTLSRKRYTLVKFFRYLMEVYAFAHNPAISLPRYDKSQQSNTPILGESELMEFLRRLKCRRHESKQAFRDYLIILGLFHLALRRYELAGLRWEDIHETPIPHFRVRQKRNRIKYLPIPAKYRDYLNEFARLHGKPSEFLFQPLRNNRKQKLCSPDHTDRPLSTNSIRDFVIRLGEEFLPGRKIEPHSFRATFICLAREHNLDDRTIMNATGHSSSDMINYYDIRALLETNAVNFFADRIE